MSEPEIDESEDLKALRAAIIEDEEVPEIVRSFLEKGARLEEIRLDIDGRWMHRGEYFTNKRLIRLFDRSVHRTDKGSWVLRIPPYTYPVIVEATGYFVDRLEDRQGQTIAVVSDGTQEPVDWSTLSTDGDRFVAIKVHDGRHWARLRGQAHQQVLVEADEVDGEWVTTQAGRRRTMNQLEPDDQLVQRLVAARTR